MRAVSFVEPTEGGAGNEPSHDSSLRGALDRVLPHPPAGFFHTPLLRAINLSIAVLLLAIVAAVYWYGWRPLPKTSGTLRAPISARATITRDQRGIPHISAGSWQDAIFLQGYAAAQDRLFQMDALRRLAAGQLAEVAGKSALDSDEDSHRWRMERIAEAQEHQLTPGSREFLAAYARGVNYFIETHRHSLPPEFAILHYDPRPWSVRDSLLVILQMYRLLTGTWREEMSKYDMLVNGDQAKVDFLYPRRTGSEVQPGSNAWAVSGARSASGKPVLANDPHLDWNLPSEWLLVHLQAPDLDVAGAALPGVPGVIIGHNRRIAWGVTNLGFDVQDLFRERIDLQTGRYLYQGRIQQALLEHDAILVKGQAPEQFDMWITHHGPIFLTEGGASYAMQWMAASDGPLDIPLLQMDRAQDWDQFKTALAAFPGPAQNFVYADAGGNIGYHVAGRLPIRKDCPSDIPLDGTSDQCDWRGVIPFDELPQVYDPPSGMIVTANQNPFPADYSYQVDGRFGSNYRAKQIRARLESQPKWQAKDMLAVQKDVYSAFSHFLAGQILAAWDKLPEPRRQPGLRPAVELLRSWNGQMEKGTAAPLVAALAYDQLRDAVANRASPGHAVNYQTSYLAPEMIERLLRQRPADWFTDYDALLLKSLADGVAAGEKLQGSKLGRWDYGQYNRLEVDNPVLGKIPLIGSYFDIGPVPMSGSSTTVKQTTRRLGPSMRMVVDLGNLDDSVINITAGESGQVLSRHYMDQWDAYYAGKSFPMEFDHVHASGVLTVVPE